MLSDRHKIAIEMREAGASFRAIGDVLGVTATRANLIYRRALVLREQEKGVLQKRSVQVFRSSLYSPAGLAAMLAQDRWKAFVTLLRLPNCSHQDAEEIIAWLEAGNRELPRAGDR